MTRGRRLLVTLMLAASAASAAELERQLADAQAALQASRFPDAERIYRSILVEEPGLADAYDGLAAALDGQGRRDEALRMLLEVGQGLGHAGEGRAAVRLLERAVRVAPDNPGAQAALGRVLLDLDHHEAAVEHLGRAIALGEPSAVVRLLLGAALWESGSFDEAERLYREAAARGGPGVEQARAQLGALLLFLGRFGEAAEVLQQVVAGDGRSVQPRFDLARALEGLGRTEAALEAYREVVGLAPQLADAHYRLALLLDRSGQGAAGQQELERFGELLAAEQERTRREGLAQARLERGRALIREGRPEAAIEHFSGLPPGVESLSGLAAACSMAGRHDCASEALENALRLDPTRRDLRIALDEERLAAAAGR